MLHKWLFRKPGNTLEAENNQDRPAPKAPDKLFTACPSCKSAVLSADIERNMNCCPLCQRHFAWGARKRIHALFDPNSFREIDAQLTSDNYIGFPDYDRKLADARRKSGENEAVLCGTASIDGRRAAVFAMEGAFMMGSMGSVVGEKITRLFELALQQGLPVIGFTVSGGARMQEGILSLMQMAKTSAAVKKHSDAGFLYICVLCDPTTGGVTASFAMQSDIALAEPSALICFAGPRVIEQTIRQKLPQGFQSAEFLLERGFIDRIVPRAAMREELRVLLMLHAKEDSHAGN